jgi:hypothetical protein
MEEQRGRQPPGDHVAHVHHLVKRVQFARVVEAAENERHQAEDVKMPGLYRTSSPEVDKQADREIKRANKVLIRVSNAASRLADDDRRFDIVYTRAADHIGRLRPGAE